MVNLLREAIVEPVQRVRTRVPEQGAHRGVGHAGFQGVGREARAVGVGDDAFELGMLLAKVAEADAKGVTCPRLSS